MAENEKPTTAERVGLAEQSSDLTLRLRSACDADKLLAVGMSAQRRPLALALHRVIYAQDASAYEEARHLLRKHVYAKALKEEWIVRYRKINAAPKPVDLRRFSDAVLTWMLNDVCPECSGRKFSLMESTISHGARVLAPRLCPVCHGSGKRAFQWRNPWWEEKGRAVATDMDAQIDRLVGKIKKKLGRERKAYK